MKTTRVGSLIGLAVIAGLVSYLVEALLVRLGEPQFIPPITLGVALFFIGVIIPVMAWPIRKTTRATEDSPKSAPVDPFYATRVLLLAKAGALTGAVLAGVGLGIVVFVVTRVVLASTPLVLTLISMIGGVVLSVGGVIAERWCQIPPTDAEGLEEGELA
ncbi:MAG: DUF3180 domain-containing protein [Aquiluna sp.]